MTYLTKQRRRERIERDDGDPDDKVYLARGIAQNPVGRVYHADKDCTVFNRQLSTDVLEWTRERAQEWVRGPCKCCVLNEYEVQSCGNKSKLEKMIEDGEVPESELGVKFPSVGD